jgi:acetyltransferase-like isoleucine patch superfamily enzyme
MSILNFLRRKSGLFSAPVPGALPASWEKYRPYIQVHPTAIIAPSATIQFYNLPKKPRVMLSIGEMSHVFGNFVFLREEASTRIGARCQIGSSHFITASSIDIGDDVMVAWGITMIDTDTHALKWDDRKNDVRDCYNSYLECPSNMIKAKDWGNVKNAPIVIGDKSWIGFNVSILKGVTLGQETVVGASSVVTRSFAGKGIIAGNPAALVRSGDE